MSEFIEVCEDAARAGGAVLLDMWLNLKVKVREKGPKDLVTEADLASQRTIKKILQAAYPSHSFLGEEDEGGSGALDAEYLWIVDPLDGTTNYVHGCPDYSVSIALAHHGEIIAGTVFVPVGGECYTAIAGKGAYLNGQPIRTSDVTTLSEALVAASFGTNVERGAPEIERFIEVLIASQATRRGGSAAQNLAFVAAGRYDGYWASSTKLWDVAAGLLLVREAGGRFTSMDGSAFDFAAPTFSAAASEPLHKELVDVLARVKEK